MWAPAKPLAARRFSSTGFPSRSRLRRIGSLPICQPRRSGFSTLRDREVKNGASGKIARQLPHSNPLTDRQPESVIAQSLAVDEHRSCRSGVSPNLRRWVSLAVFSTALSHLACERSGRKEPAQVAPIYDSKTGRLQLLKLDSNGNGRIDTWSYMDGSRVV